MKALFITIILTAFIFFALQADGLPEVPVLKKWIKCSKDSECAVAGDGCRSCGKLTIINRKYLKDYNELDYKLRKNANMNITCEACSTEKIHIFCKGKNCTYNK